MEGGMENHIAALTAYQRDAGLEVDLVFNQGKSTAAGDLQVLAEFDLFRLRPQALAVIVFSLAVMARLLKVRRRYDVIHVHGDWSALVFAGVFRRICRADVLAFTVHDDLTSGVGHESLLPRLVRQADVIFSTGYRAARLLETRSGRPVVFRTSGVSDSFFAPTQTILPTHGFTALTVARLVRKKNIGLVLDIARRLPSVEFLIVGDGPERPGLRERMTRESLGNVRLLGKMSHREIRQVMDSAQCFLMTSHEEGTPTALLEAMACGLPIVTTPAGGVSAIVENDVNGYVVESREADQYAERIARLFDASRRERIRLKNLKDGARFRWSVVAAEITAALSSVLAAKRHGAKLS